MKHWQSWPIYFALIAVFFSASASAAAPKTLVYIHKTTTVGQTVGLRGAHDSSLVTSKYPSQSESFTDNSTLRSGTSGSLNWTTSSTMDWTTNSSSYAQKYLTDGYGYDAENTWGADYWKWNAVMTGAIGAWFEFKGVLLSSGTSTWESNVSQSSTPYSTINHWGRQGFATVVDWSTSAVTAMYPLYARGAFYFDELAWAGTTGEVVDSSYSGLNGTALLGATNASGKICTAASFTGSSDEKYISVPATLLNGETDFTFMAWIKTSYNKTTSILSGIDSGNSQEIELRVTKDSKGGADITTTIGSKTFTTKPATDATDNAWHHVAWVVSGKTETLYLDGVAVGTNTYSSAAVLDIAGLIIGKSHGKSGSVSNGANQFSGLIDEPRFYNGAMRAADIATIYTNQNAGKNDDGTARICPANPVLVANYRMDACTLDHGSGDVVDSSGGGHNLTSQNNTTITTGKLCNAGSFAGGNDRMTGTWSQAFGTGVSLTAWFKSSGGGDTQGRVVEITSGSGVNAKGAAITLDTTSLKAWATASDGTQVGAMDYQTVKYTDGVWHHVAYTYDGTTAKLYVDSVLKQTVTSSNTTGDLLDSTDIAIGGKAQGAGASLKGEIDEVSIYTGTLTSTQISTFYSNNVASLNDDGSARTCTTCSTMNHYTISHSGTGIACEDQTITFTAHNSSHATTSRTNTTTITLSTSTGKGAWGKVSAGGTLTDTGTADDGAATYTFAAAGETSIQLYLRHVQSGTVNINVTDGTYTESSGTVEAGSDPNLVISDAGLRFYADGVNNTIGAQIAGKASNVAPSSQTIKIKAIKTATDTGACIAAVTGAQTVGWAMECISPATCVAGQTLSLSNGGTASLNPSGSIGSYTTSSMTFDASGESVFNFTYSDAGQIRLNARWGYTKPDSTLYYLTGTSNTFTSRPFGYYMAVTGNTAAADHTGSAFKKAGATFAATVTAKAWAAGDDTNNDGVPDGFADTTANNNADLSNNSTTPNYGQEASPPAIALAATLIHPTVAAGGAAGALGGTTSITPSSGVASSSNLTYSEVGVIELGASVSNYMSSYGITGKSGYVGRFYPDHFTLIGTPTLTNRSALSSCTDTFTYLGENMGLSSLVLEARNVSDIVTTNYEEPAGYDYAYLTTSQLGFGAIDSPSSSATSLTSRLSTSGLSGTWSNGRATYTGTALIVRPTSSQPGGPFSDMRLGFKPVDSDSVALATSALNLDPAISGSSTHQQLAIGNLRLGRLYLESASGSELQALTMPLYAQYYNGSNWLTNTLDNCTTYTGSSITFSNYSSPLTAGDTTASGSGTITAGKAASAAPIKLSAPSGSHTGAVTVTLPLTTFSYLKGNYDGVDQSSDSDLNDDNPFARATFGVVGNSSPVIYKREQY